MNDTPISWPAGIKRTHQRKCVLHALTQAKTPLSASELCSRMRQNGESVWLSTVYRILELFVNEGIALKTSVINAETAVYELCRSTHKHYAVCVQCRRMIPIKNCPLEAFHPCLDGEEFHITGHALQLYGYCKDCLPES